ncbi:hypothetical protein [Candidatus Cryosericum terrychapinii]|uniref:Uncharacterized protein n=1 Tax=Candidatus Cryosericum terrychapinii TaxID=2290919 RepID=A0A398CVY1_9BACT|nr:hypothetical protein [Candidatus Cryosericum terrychapinii]RIE06805.1 hypothetical protein SMC7_00725 [Candidatus Cryosericum terrychapinii]
MDPEEIRKEEMRLAQEMLDGDSAQAKWLIALLGKDVEVTLVVGRPTRGKLGSFDGETLVIELDTGTNETILVFKSAILSVEESLSEPGLLA